MKRDAVAIYKMVVYRDGYVELTPEPLADANVSSRVWQIIAVIDNVFQEIKKGHLWPSLNEAFLNKQVSLAYKRVAEANSISESSVSDKAQRQLGLTKSDFVKLVLDWLISTKHYTETDLYRVITQRAANAANDINFANTWFERWENSKKEEL